MKLTAFFAAALLATTAMAQTPAPAAPETAPAPAAAPAQTPQPTWTFAMHGFVSLSAAYQVGAFTPAEGQMSLGSATNPGSAAAVPDKGSLTLDVRQSIFNFSVQGPKVLGGATPSGVMELDFFGGFGGGAFGDVSVLPRLRLAYGELDWGDHKLQFGQQNDLVFALAPTSLSHIAFPLGYYTGNLGWRRPGVFGYHTFRLPSDLELEAAWEVGRSQWAHAGAIGAGAVDQPGGISQAEASGVPALEGRVTLKHAKHLTAFAAAHWQKADLTGYGDAVTPPAPNKTTVETSAFDGGVVLTLPIGESDMRLTIQGTGFIGQNLAPLFVLSGFGLGPNGEDVRMVGWWAQAGFAFTKELSVWAFHGNQAIDRADFIRSAGAGGAYDNTTTNLMAMYREGGLGLSAEWIHFETKYLNLDPTTQAVVSDVASKSDQYMVTANYFF